MEKHNEINYPQIIIIQFVFRFADFNLLYDDAHSQQGLQFLPLPQSAPLFLSGWLSFGGEMRVTITQP